MSRPRARPRRVEILRATREVLETAGVAGLTALKVAERVPISEAAVFHHFRSKDELLLELGLELAAEEMQYLGDVARSARNGVEAVCAVVRGRIDHYRDRPETLELVHFWTLSRADTERREALFALSNEVFDILERRLRDDIRARRAPPVRNLRRYIVSAWVMSDGLILAQHRMHRGHLTSRHSLEDVCREILDQIRLRLGKGDGQ